MLEYGNIGVLGFERINPSFHPFTIPNLTTLERGATKHMRLFQQPAGANILFHAHILSEIILGGIIAFEGSKNSLLIPAIGEAMMKQMKR